MTTVEDRCSTLAIQSLESVSRPFNQIMLSFLFPDSTQLTGTPPGPLWSFRRCRASRASSPASCPSPTSPPLKGSIAPMLQELCFSSPVSLATSERSAKHLFLGESWLTQDSLPLSLLCSTGHGHLYGGDSPLPGETLWGLALLLVLHPGLGRHAYDLFCRWKEKKRIQIAKSIQFKQSSKDKHMKRFICCRYFLHMCLQRVWMQERERPALDEHSQFIWDEQRGIHDWSPTDMTSGAANVVFQSQTYIMSFLRFIHDYQKARNN